jgi:hypothetical protein
MVRDETKRIRTIAFCFSGDSKSNHWNLNFQAFSRKKTDLSSAGKFYPIKGMIISYNG